MSDVERAGTPLVPGYEVVRRIARGGFGAIYEAVQTAVGRTVALKVLPGSGVDDASERQFRAEARTIGSLSWHPNVVSLFDAGVTPHGDPYLVMELVPGGTAGDLIRAGAPASPALTAKLGVQMADALAAAHAAGVLHRDVKPDNILIGRNGDFQLGDFGIATLSDGTRSRSGSFTGTFAYMAPELLKGERASAASDIYSLGATLYAMAAGRQPFAGASDATPAALLLRIVTEDPPPLPDDVPPELARVIGRAMSREVGERQPTALALKAELVQARSLLAADEDERDGGTPPEVAEPLTNARVADDGDERGPAGSVTADLVDAPATVVVPRRSVVAEAERDPRPRRRRGLVAGGVGALLVLGGLAIWWVMADRGGTKGDGGSESTSILSTVQVGSGPTSVVSDDGSIWVTNSEDGTVSLIDPDDDRVTSTVDVGGLPWVAAPGARSIWVTDAEGRQVFRIDSATRKVEATVDLDEQPWAVAYGSNAVWVTQPDAGAVVRVDPATEEVVATVDIGSPVYWLTAGGGSIWASSADGVHRIDPKTNEVAETIAVDGQPGPLAFGLDDVWVSADGANAVWRIDPKTSKVISTIKTPAAPRQLAPGAGDMWVVMGDSVGRLDPTTERVEVSIGVGSEPSWITAGDGSMWVANQGDATVSRINP